MVIPSFGNNERYPACVCEILIRPECPVEWELRILAANDARL